MTSNGLWILIILVTVSLISTATGRILKKRQIYREQVLPHAGGKIPDTAFQTDRLFLNHLQKEGIAIPDGIVLQQRNPQVYPFLNKQSRAVYKVALSSDGRYIPNEGRYFYNSPPSVDTTYLIPQIHDYPDRTPSVIPAFPVYRQLHLQNALLNQPKLQTKLKTKKKSFLYLSPYSKTSTLGSDKLKIIKPQPQTTFKLLNDPLGILSNNHFNTNYGPAHTQHLFNEFDSLFNGLQLDNPRPIYKP